MAQIVNPTSRIVAAIERAVVYALAYRGWSVLWAVLGGPQNELYVRDPDFDLKRDTPLAIRALRIVAALDQ